MATGAYRGIKQKWQPTFNVPQGDQSLWQLKGPAATSVLLPDLPISSKKWKGIYILKCMSFGNGDV